MTRVPVVLLALATLACAPLLRSQDEPAAAAPFSPDELDNLLAPVALYPDPLLAQILLAATFSDQVDEAARFLRAGADPNAIDVQPWDVSVKALAHYPTVLYMMADRLDWTTALGQAYVNQGDDVMQSVQRLRQEAQAAGNLQTTPQCDVVQDDGAIEIWPEPEYLYLPIYDPALVFFGSGGRFGGPVISFGGPLPIGVWLNVDFDWHHKHIYYHGWSQGGGWIARSRPYVHTNNVYENDRLRTVAVNRAVSRRAVNYGSLNLYNSVHQNVTFRSSRASAAGPPVENKIIQRNMDVNDPRIGANRGAAPPPEQRQAAPQSQSEPRSSAFGGSHSSFTPRESSQRGQASRSAPVKSAPAPRSSGGGGGSHGGGGGGGGSHGGGGRH